MDIQEAPSKCLELIDGDAFGILLCPNCRAPRLHIGSVRVWRDGKLISHMPDGGVHFNECPARDMPSPNGEGRARGAVVILDTFCEDCPTTHEVVLQFHKGSIYAKSFTCENEDAIRPEDIWRD